MKNLFRVLMPIVCYAVFLIGDCISEDEFCYIDSDCGANDRYLSTRL